MQSTEVYFSNLAFQKISCLGQSFKDLVYARVKLGLNPPEREDLLSGVRSGPISEFRIRFMGLDEDYGISFFVSASGILITDLVEMKNGVANPNRLDAQTLRYYRKHFPEDAAMLEEKIGNGNFFFKSGSLRFRIWLSQLYRGRNYILPVALTIPSIVYLLGKIADSIASPELFTLISITLTVAILLPVVILINEDKPRFPNRKNYSREIWEEENDRAHHGSSQNKGGQHWYNS